MPHYTKTSACTHDLISCKEILFIVLYEQDFLLQSKILVIAKFLISM